MDVDATGRYSGIIEETPLVLADAKIYFSGRLELLADLAQNGFV